MSSNLIKRILVALIFGPLIILFSYWGGLWLYGMILLFAIIGINEFQFGNKIKPICLHYPLATIAVILIIILTINKSLAVGASVFIGFFLINGILYAIQNKPTEKLFKRHVISIWSVAYVGFLWPFIFHIRQLSPDKGGDWLLFLFGTLWLSDSLAMFGGKLLGKRKLAPTVSPNKTVAGFICGLAGGIIVAVILHFWRLDQFSLVYLIPAGLSVSFIGQLGDLVESMWKRAIGIKDSSKIIPGHGGILDRFDSLLFASPVLFYFLTTFIYN